jgi:DNA-binding NarL/FixJ family response regulator
MDLVIVEDSELVQTQLLRLVSLHGGIDVVGIAASEEAAVSLVVASNPDAVLLDLTLAPGSGIRVLERIRQAGCTARVLVVTNNAADVLRRSCEALGISGFYDKSRDVPACMDQLFGWLEPSEDAPQAVLCGKPEAHGSRSMRSDLRPSVGRFQGALS